MFLKRHKNIKYNIVICANSTTSGDSINKIINDKPNNQHNKYNVVETFYYGRPCIDYLRKNMRYIDLVIVDADMEGLDGYDVCRLIRELDADIKLILISKDKKKLFQAKEMYLINEVLLHPWQPSYLWSRIDNVFNEGEY